MSKRSGRLSYKDNFEAVYLRESLIAKNCRTISNERMKEIWPMAEKVGSHFYHKFHKLMYRVGMEKDDIVSITAMYMHTFLCSPGNVYTDDAESERRVMHYQVWQRLNTFATFCKRKTKGIAETVDHLDNDAKDKLMGAYE